MLTSWNGRLAIVLLASTALASLPRTANTETIKSDATTSAGASQPATDAALETAGLPRCDTAVDGGEAAKTASALDRTVEGGAADADRRIKEFIDPRTYQLSSEKDRAQQAKDHVEHRDRFRLEAGMKRHEFSMNAPQTTIRWERKEMRFSIPTPAQCKIGVTNIPEWHGIWTVRMVPHDILVPCTKQKEIVVEIPVPKVEVWYGPTRGAFSVPEFRQTDFKDELDDAEQQIRRLDDELQHGSENIRRDSIVRTEAEIRKQIADGLISALAAVDQAEAAKVGPIEKQRADLAASADTGRRQFAEAGGDPAKIEKAFAPGIAALDAGIAALRNAFAIRRDRTRLEFAQLEAKYLGGGGDKAVQVPVCPAPHAG